jgi:hypothetical protein
VDIHVEDLEGELIVGIGLVRHCQQVTHGGLEGQPTRFNTALSSASQS